MISKTFYIRVDEDGTQTPVMDFFPPQYNVLAHLGLDDFSKSRNIVKLLEKLEEAKANNLNFSFAVDDWCIVEVSGPQSKVSNGFDEFESFQLETDFLIELFQDWKLFLIKYECGKIKGLI